MSAKTTPGKALKDVLTDARTLMDVTAEATGEKVAKARKRLAAALERGRSEEEALVGSASDAIHDTISELHRLLTAALERGADTCSNVRTDVVDKAKAADSVVRDNPYRAIGVALGVGTLFGYLASSRHCGKKA